MNWMNAMLALVEFVENEGVVLLVKQSYLESYERKSRKDYSRLVENIKRETLKSINSFYGWIQTLKEMGYLLHETLEQGANEFVRGSIHVNGIEGSWSVVKTRLSKFRGIKKSHIYLHLKECECRFNHYHENMYDLLLLNLRGSPLK